MTLHASAPLAKLRDNVALAYRGEPRAVDLLLTALLARGHVLIEDVPGVGKTTLARALGRSLSLEFRRIQFTSDTLPADVIGISVFHAPADRFEFHPGRSSPTSSWPTRSTAPRPRRSPRSSRR